MKRESDLGRKQITFGIPGKISLDTARIWVEPRVSKKRLEHIKGVAEVGREIALGLKLDPFPIELACWLHDACKELKVKELIQMATESGRRLTPEEEELGHVLHGPVAAIIVRRELGITNQDVLNAIAEHTLGAIGMSVISKIVYLADKLESSRPEDLTEPIWRALNAIPKEGPPNACHDLSKSCVEDLDRAMLTAITLITKNLLKKGKPIQPRAMEVRNHFIKVISAQELERSR
ncbi:MAG: bis(5'-nucleosyl)-tetraphosphatase (symmetrical) YqeK [Candidatus Obscuribacterales bacterium]|nr:bis(5'-nucleosyl)-tetraphosphatase (symmetrical) YqeK [Candidatus Obscuribacterales bacterium]